MDYFRLGPDGEAGRSSSFLLVTPGISPIFGNNPGLHVLSYDRKAFSLLDYTTHRLDLAAGSSADWKEEYRFSRAYSLFPVTRTTLRNSLPVSPGGSATRATYIDYYNVGNPASPQMTDQTWPLYWCAIEPSHGRALQDLRGKFFSALSRAARQRQRSSESRNDPQGACDRHQILK